jgi:hypothetical protein
MSIDPDSGETIPEGMVAPFPDPGQTAQNHDAQATSRLITLYRNKTKMAAMLALHAELAQTIEDCLVQIPPLDNPAVATGVNLDDTGDLVGQGRVLSDGTVSSDLFYRTLITARIAKNNSHASSPQYITALETVVFIGTPFRYYDLGYMTVGIEVPGAPNSNMRAVINNGPMPKAAAVGVVKTWFNDAAYFAFDEDTDPEAEGFGEIGSPSVGGDFAELF